MVSVPKHVALITIMPDEYDPKTTSQLRSLQISGWLEHVDHLIFELSEIYPITC